MQPVPVWDGEGHEGGVPEHLQDKGFRVGQRAPVRQPRPPLPPDDLVWGRWRAGRGSGSGLVKPERFGPAGRWFMGSPSSSWIFLWMSGYKATYMRLQDSAVATVSKPGRAWKRHSVTTRGQRSGCSRFHHSRCLFPISCHQKALVTSQEGAQQQLHTPKRGQSVTPAAPHPHPASSCALGTIPTCPKEVVDDVDDLLVGELDVGILPDALLLAVPDQRVRDVPDVLLGKSRRLRDTTDTQRWGNLP